MSDRTFPQIIAIGEHYYAAMMNDDESGLEDGEIELLQEYLNDYDIFDIGAAKLERDCWHKCDISGEVCDNLVYAKVQYRFIDEKMNTLFEKVSDENDI